MSDRRAAAVRGRVRAREAGFSLIEVLGAIAILGVWFAVMSEIAMVGLRNEGRSYRTMLASLVADDLLAEIEIDMMRGTWPGFRNDEDERDDYIIRIDVEPYDLNMPAREARLDSREPADPGGSPFEHLEGQTPEARGPLVSVRIEVAWMEGNSEQSVVRHTFGADLGTSRDKLAAHSEQDEVPLDGDPLDSGTVGGGG